MHPRFCLGNPNNNYYFFHGMLTKNKSGSRGRFLKIGKIGLPAALVAPNAAASAEPVLPDSAGSVSRLPNSTESVNRLPDFTVLAKGKRPPVASPAG
eukprot:4474038-Amphidinium_carterae.1